MGIDLPPQTKLAVDLLERKLTTAINNSQGILSFGADKFPIDPSALSVWKVSHEMQRDFHTKTH
jgi:hypothetical protein